MRALRMGTMSPCIVGIAREALMEASARSSRSVELPQRMLAEQIVGELLCKIHTSLVRNVEPLYFDADRAILNKDRALEFGFRRRIVKIR
jgi:hypothetical protein